MVSGPIISLGTPDVGLSSPRIPSSIEWASNPNEPLISNLSTFDAERKDDVMNHENEDLGALTVVSRELVLDKTAESNTLPFVLQGYATWIHRLALDPVQLTNITGDFVFSHFDDGEQSRWIVILLANAGSRVGSADAKPNRMLLLLQNQVRRKLLAVNSSSRSKRPALVKALSSAVETTFIHFLASPVNEAITIIQEAAPVFRQLCPEPSNVPINLPSLLQQPLGCLRQYAHIDIFFNILTDMPTLFRYDTVSPGGYPSYSYPSAAATQSDGVLQWLHGISNQVIILFAKMQAIRFHGLTPEEETIASLEREIHELQKFVGSSSEPFLKIMRFIVQEC